MSLWNRSLSTFVCPNIGLAFVLLECINGCAECVSYFQTVHQTVWPDVNVKFISNFYICEDKDE